MLGYRLTMYVLVGPVDIMWRLQVYLLFKVRVISENRWKDHIGFIYVKLLL